MVGVSPQRYAIVLAAVLTAVMTPVCPTIDFQSHAPTIMLGTTNAQLKIVNNQQIIGWGDRSIVETFGRDVMSSWPEGYSSGVVISQTGGTQQPPLELVQANSSALLPLCAPLRTMSNAVLASLRVNSNALRYGDRVNSSAIISLASIVRTHSNAFAFGIKNNSNAINLLYRNLTVPTTDSIDGTQFVRYHAAHHVFHNNANAWTIRGWVRFNNGFTVMPRASVLMDTLTTVSGGMDLRDTGTLILNNDLYLAHNVTLTNGGNIKGRASSSGQANTIFMGGDLTLSATTYARVLHITGDWSASGNSGDLIIDGCGHTLSIEDRAQIFVDTSVTLTLRNMTIRTGQKSSTVPAIRLAAQGSKLALDNVVFDLGTDFRFKQGQIFIHNEVAVTGTSAFIYQSPMPSYIAPGATWGFEQGTTFSVAPTTYTDIPYTGTTATSNNFIVFADASSALYLNGCSFQTTYTGLRLRTGMVLFDNRVAMDTMAGMSMVTTTTTPVAFAASAATGSGPYSARFSPDGRFIAVACFTGNTLQIFRFNGGSKPTLLYTVPTLTNPCILAWSPDGRFIAVPCITSSVLQIFSFTGNSAPTLIGSYSVSSPYFAAWSPDGKFLATANWSSGTTSIFRFSGVGAPTLLGTLVNGSYPSAVAWSPDGRYLAVTERFGSQLFIYRFNGSTAPASAPLYAVPSGTYTRGVSWTPDGRFLAVVNWNGNSITFFSFNGTSAPASLGAPAVGTWPIADAWSPDGRILATANQAGNSMSILCLYGLRIPTSVMATVATGSGPLSVDWSPDGAYIAVASNGVNSLQIYRCNFYYTGQPAPGFTTSLVFGDKAKGATYDANVQVLGRGTVAIKGMVRDDSA